MALLVVFGNGQHADQLDAIKTAGTVVLGTGGAAALWLTARRQQTGEIGLNQKAVDQHHAEQQFAFQQQQAADTRTHLERVAAATEADARERRTIDLYAKAADQLGSDKAPVRLAGVYALERLAQDNPDQRQMVVNLLCAYLRMPFEPTLRRPEQRGSSRIGSRSLRIAGPAGRVQGNDEELLVRKTIQLVLRSHLCANGHSYAWFADAFDGQWPGLNHLDGAFWPGMDLDLAGATLVDFEMNCAAMASADFRHARLIGGGLFGGARFRFFANFAYTRFEDGAASFPNAWFGSTTQFTHADFGPQQANFAGTTFSGMASFTDITVPGGIDLTAARALTNYKTNAGAPRLWPTGWTERPLGADEPMPQPSFDRLWDVEDELPTGTGVWSVVGRDEASAEPVVPPSAVRPDAG
ncbi:pentapeptide repeat-containing protein [Kutzneria sp. 744]|uniref:pentapeptide repeat-containing protein n=1 Tax=Kutzneria sp. (strain 744) TaxID=345341 RepID=UPI001E35604A|nr:pentapeptide repeat-containing protein [Kutzneria sp. 744]